MGDPVFTFRTRNSNMAYNFDGEIQYYEEKRKTNTKHTKRKKNREARDSLISAVIF